MLTAGLACPETSELNVEMSGMLASTVPTGLLLKSFQPGCAVLNASQPGPWRSGIGFAGAGAVGVGSSALAVVRRGHAGTVAAGPPGAAPGFLVGVFHTRPPRPP